MSLLKLFSKTDTRPARGPRVRTHCRNPRVHTFPVLMQHHADDLNHHGGITSVYHCPACRYREGWVEDFDSGEIRRLWQKPFKPNGAKRA